MSLERRVLETVAGNLEKKYAVTLESRLVEDLEMDSFHTIMVIAGLEDEFGLSLDEQDFTGIHRVSDIVHYLREKYPQLAGE